MACAEPPRVLRLIQSRQTQQRAVTAKKGGDNESTTNDSRYGYISNARAQRQERGAEDVLLPVVR